jgi:hypothetical protein
MESENSSQHSKQPSLDPAISFLIPVHNLLVAIHFNISNLCLSIYLSIYLPTYDSTVILLDLGWFFLILYTAGMTPWTGDQPVARPLPIHRRTQTQNKSTQTSIRWVGFEPTTLTFERANEDSSWLTPFGQCDRPFYVQVSQLIITLHLIRATSCNIT